MITNRQPQAGTAVLAGRVGLGLTERLEHIAHLLLGHADAGVDDSDLHTRIVVVVARHPDHHADAARLREFDRVTYQVDQDLSQPGRVGVNRLSRALWATFF